jgi:hypothetical protein
MTGLGTRARALFEGHYKEDRMLNTYKELYFDLLKKKFPARADALGIGRILGSPMS